MTKMVEKWSTPLPGPKAQVWNKIIALHCTSQLKKDDLVLNAIQLLRATVHFMLWSSDFVNGK